MRSGGPARRRQKGSTTSVQESSPRPQEAITRVNMATVVVLVAMVTTHRDPDMNRISTDEITRLLLYRPPQDQHLDMYSEEASMMRKLGLRTSCRLLKRVSGRLLLILQSTLLKAGCLFGKVRDRRHSSLTLTKIQMIDFLCYVD